MRRPASPCGPPRRPRASSRAAARRGAGLAVLLAASALAGCGGPDPTTLRLSLAASTQVNPNTENQPSPTLVRIYALRTPDAFNAATFADLYDNGAAKLGPDLLEQRELFVEPGKTAELKSTLPAQTTVLGVVAGFRQLDQATWRLTVPITAREGNRVKLLVGAHALARAPRPSGFLFGLF